MAYISDPQRLTGFCECRVGNGERLCFSRGAIGTLSGEQVSQYCKEQLDQPLSPGEMEDLDKFKLNGEIMHQCLQKDVTTNQFPQCVIKIAKQLGYE